MLYEPVVSKGETLMEEGEYSLVKWAPENAEAYFPLQSYIAHRCEGGTWCWWDPKYINERCSGCEGLPPEDIMALWKLHNWDWIQQEES